MKGSSVTYVPLQCFCFSVLYAVISLQNFFCVFPLHILKRFTIHQIQVSAKTKSDENDSADSVLQPFVSFLPLFPLFIVVISLVRVAVLLVWVPFVLVILFIHCRCKVTVLWRLNTWIYADSRIINISFLWILQRFVSLLHLLKLFLCFFILIMIWMQFLRYLSVIIPFFKNCCRIYFSVEDWLTPRTS